MMRAQTTPEPVPKMKATRPSAIISSVFGVRNVSAAIVEPIATVRTSNIQQRVGGGFRQTVHAQALTQQVAKHQHR